MPLPRFTGRNGFDRILADVPCSGDGTLRKDPASWRTWDPKYAMHLHRTQLRILMRALATLAPGGTLIYSTCSFNPVENEAVVGAALLGAAMDGLNVELVRPELPVSLAASVRSGLTTWAVPDLSSASVDLVGDHSTHADKPRCWQGRWLNSFKGTPKASRKGVRSTMFPLAEVEASTEEAAAWAATITEQLPRCLRLMPFNEAEGGGFFVAVIRRPPSGDDGGTPVVPTPPPATPDDAAAAGRAVVGHASSPPPAGAADDGDADAGEGPFFTCAIDPADQELEEATKRYGLHSHLWLCTDGDPKGVGSGDGHEILREGNRLVLVSRELAALLRSMRLEPRSRRPVALVAGLRLLKRMPSSTIRASVCRWRPCQEGAAWLGQATGCCRLLADREALLEVLHARSTAGPCAPREASGQLYLTRTFAPALPPLHSPGKCPPTGWQSSDLQVAYAASSCTSPKTSRRD